MRAVSIITIFGLFFFSCKKEYCDNPVPQIEYKDFIQYNGEEIDSAKLIISFIDCDGDIGLTQQDTTTNLKLEYYEWEKNTETGEYYWKHFELGTTPGTVPFYYRVPMLNSEGKNDILQGDIQVSMPFYYSKFSPNDTFRFSITLIDRALNESNRIFTPDLRKP